MTWEREGLEYSASCTCLPTYYSVAWLDKKQIRKKLGRNRKVAEQTLPHVQVAEDKEDPVLLGAAKNISFADWADKWLKRLTVEQATKESYEQTLRRAWSVRRESVRRPTAGDVRALLDHLTWSRNSTKQQRPLTETTPAKLLRNLSTCLEGAIPEYLAINPVGLLKKQRAAQAAAGRGRILRGRGVATSLR